MTYHVVVTIPLPETSTRHTDGVLSKPPRPPLAGTTGFSMP